MLSCSIPWRRHLIYANQYKKHEDGLAFHSCAFVRPRAKRTWRLFRPLATSLPPGFVLWHTFPTYVTSTCFPISLWITNRTFTLHSGRLHSAPPLKNTAEWILREFSDLTWLFLKRKLHHGLLSFTLFRKIRVQSPLSSRPPLGKVLIGIFSQSSFVSLNLATVPSIFTRKYLSSLSSSSSSDESDSSYKIKSQHLICSRSYALWVW